MVGLVADVGQGPAVVGEGGDVFGVGCSERVVEDVGGAEAAEDTRRHRVSVQRRRARLCVLCCAVGIVGARGKHCRIDEHSLTSPIGRSQP